jgi:hypothetical protein
MRHMHPHGIDRLLRSATLLQNVMALHVISFAQLSRNTFRSDNSLNVTRALTINSDNGFFMPRAISFKSNNFFPEHKELCDYAKM